jgi:hypothetical protein
MEVLCVPSLAVAVEGHGRVDLPGGTEMEQFYQASAADSIIHGLGDRSISLSLFMLFLFPTGYFSILIIRSSIIPPLVLISIHRCSFLLFNVVPSIFLLLP